MPAPIYHHSFRIEPVLRIRNVYTRSLRSEFFPSCIPDPGSKRFRIPDSDPRQRVHVSILTPKNCFWALENMIWDLGFRIRSIFPSRIWIQGSKRHRIPDPDPQHRCIRIRLFYYQISRKSTVLCQLMGQTYRTWSPRHKSIFTWRFFCSERRLVLNSSYLMW
jgi:hypothetical protein